MNIIRQSRLDSLYGLKDNGMIKVLTGVRRCGKSILLNQFKDFLLSKGIKTNQIIEINFESLQFERLYNSKNFHNYILQKTIDDKMYLLLDELWLVNDFTSILQTLFKKNHYDIYIASSNTRIFNDEFKKAFDKKYQEIHLLPFSFKSYYELTNKDQNSSFNDYVRYGSLPHVSKINDLETNISYIEGIFNTIVIKDLIETKKVSDLELLINIVKYLMDSIGKSVTPGKIALDISATGKRVTPTIVENYIQALLDSFVIYKTECFNIKSKLKVKGLEKYYVSDFGFRIIELGDKKYDMEYNLENIIYLELIRRGYTVFVGKYDNNSVDFYVTKGKEKIYYQVIESINKKDLLTKKITPLNSIRDNYPKIILSLDDTKGKVEGITHQNIIDWLLN